MHPWVRLTSHKMEKQRKYKLNSPLLILRHTTTVLELADKSQFLQPVATLDVQSSAISKVRKNIDNKNTFLRAVPWNNTYLVQKRSFTGLEWSIYTVQMKRQAESVGV